MLFNTFQFFLFFAAFVPIYFLTPWQRRWVPILIGSYLFYMAWNIALSALLLSLTVVAYALAILIERAQHRQTRKLLLIGGVVAELTPLVIFKYSNLLISTVNGIVGIGSSWGGLPLLNLILPVGISFHTFQVIGYLADVHAGRAARSATWDGSPRLSSSSPQLVAGPIERSNHMLPQFRRPTMVEYVRFRTARCSSFGAWRRRSASRT